MSSPAKPASENGRYRIDTSSLKDGDFERKVHPFDATAVRNTIPIGQLCGLTKLGVHFIRLPPYSKSSVLHWHSQDDEWIYVVEATDSGATLVTLPDGEKEPREEPIHKGDFVAFPTATRIAHVIHTGDSEITYLCSGTKVPVDVCTYPLMGRKLVIDRESEMWYTDEEHVTYRQ